MALPFLRILVSFVSRFGIVAKFRMISGVLKAKSRRNARALCAGAHAIALLLAALGTPATAQHFRVSEDVISDPVTGAAILGFDPVQYFLGDKARNGNPDHQANFAGKVWFFISAANRSAFEASPDTYIPVFGGHDPVAIASGIAVSGSPDIFALKDGKLYLFRRNENRDLFLGKPELLTEAQRNWAEVKRNLSP